MQLNKQPIGNKKSTISQFMEVRKMEFRLENRYIANGEDFVNRLKRISGCKTQKELADIMGVTPSYVAKWNRGSLPSQQI